MCLKAALIFRSKVSQRTLKAGDGFQVPPETPHAGVKNGGKKTRLAITYVVEKGKPLVTPVKD